MAAQPQLACLLTLKKIVPHLVQLGNCRLEWRDEEPFAFTSHDSKAVESLERIGHFEIKVDREIFRKPRLDTTCNLGRRWRYLRLADEVICERRFLGLLVFGSGNQVVENARIVVDIAEVHIFSELHVVLQRLMLIFQPLAYGKATERDDPHQGRECRFSCHVVFWLLPAFGVRGAGYFLITIARLPSSKPTEPASV